MGIWLHKSLRLWSCGACIFIAPTRFFLPWHHETSTLSIHRIRVVIFSKSKGKTVECWEQTEGRQSLSLKPVWCFALPPLTKSCPLHAAKNQGGEGKNKRNNQHSLSWEINKGIGSKGETFGFTLLLLQTTIIIIFFFLKDPNNHHHHGQAKLLPRSMIDQARA
jgi:hypothetical protein